MAPALPRFGLSRLVPVAAAVALAAAGCAPRHAEGPRTHPRQVLIIRHAEKPPDRANSTDLSAEGTARAEALHALFERSDARPEPFAAPDFIFAARNSGKSHRPVLTVAPLAAKLNLPIDAGFTNDAPADLARELFGNPRYAGKTVLISWRHGATPELAQLLGARSAPLRWKDNVFDRVWEITYAADGTATFADRPQRLMPGDSAE
ncbi:histidine phosphatase family protein [Gemmata sp.]|uniref:histidine phosphatase family protein n=1 Tax=Gemmata sp. TaxID=1914242 RepID=UPI003F70509A